MSSVFSGFNVVFAAHITGNLVSLVAQIAGGAEVRTAMLLSVPDSS